MRFIDPEHIFNPQHALSSEAAERFAMRDALKKNKDRKRAERKSSTHTAGGHYRRRFVRHSSPSHS
jgi:hypothetical protein